MKQLSIALALIAGAATAAGAQTQDFDWRGSVPPGQTVEIRGVNGGVRAVAAAGERVHVTATRSGDESDPASVRIEVVEHAGGVTICAVYPTPADAARENECRPGGGQHSTGRNDVEVDFLVRVPDGVAFAGHTVNGDIEADGLAGAVEAATVNGDVEIRTTGVAEARSVNGDIRGRLGGGLQGRDVGFETVNGSILLELPQGMDADLRAATVNGRIDSDFPVTVRGPISPRSIRGVLGEGGPELRLSTVNGNVVLRRI